MDKYLKMFKPAMIHRLREHYPIEEEKFRENEWGNIWVMRMNPDAIADVGSK